MAQLNSEVRHVFRVTDIFGAPVSALTSVAFTLTLRRRSGESLIGTAEAAVIQEIGGGEYWAIYTPTVAEALYVLNVAAVSASHAVSAPPEGFQDDVGSATELVPQLNAEVRHVFRVATTLGAPVSGLLTGNFALTLRRRSGSNLVSTSEVPFVLAIGGGEYWAVYTPTAASTLYVLTVTAVSGAHIVSAPPEGFQTDIGAESAPAGPYLTTRSRIKTAFNFKTDEHDARIDQLLPQVTDLFQSYCDRQFVAAEVTEYLPALSNYARVFLAGRPPIITVTSLHISTAVPRVYDATTLLVEGTDFFVSEEGQWIELVTPRAIYGSPIKVAKLVYTGGFAAIPGDLERAAQEVIGVKVLKASGKLYHFLSESAGDGAMQGLRWDDVTPNALAVMDSYRLRAVA